MMKKNCWALLLLLLLGLPLFGCDTSDPTVVDNQEKNPPLLYYYGGVINTVGEVIFPPAEGKEYQILLDKQGRQRYILEQENYFDPERLTVYDEPLLIGCTLRVYTAQGQLQREIYVEAEGDVGSTVSFLFSPDGSLGKSRVLVNRLLTEGCWQLLDSEGNLLHEEQVLTAHDLEQWWDSYLYAEIGGNFMTVGYNLYGYGEDYLEGVLFCGLDGQPMPTPEDYKYFYNLYDEYNYCYSDYYLAYYEGPQGQTRHDLLDFDGKVLVSGLGYVESYADGFMVASWGTERGLMDMQGNWVYSEAVPEDLEE